MNRLLIPITATLIVLTLFGIAVHDAGQIKTVTLSHSRWMLHDYLTDQHASDEELALASCVSVEPHGSCDAIPAKYYIVWSK